MIKFYLIITKFWTPFFALATFVSILVVNPYYPNGTSIVLVVIVVVVVVYIL